MSVRASLEKHRADPMCAGCHARMDPLGFGLENFDAIGRYRTMDGKFPIDSSGTLPNGKSFKNAEELIQILQDDKDAFTRCLVEKMLTFAIGRGLERYDRPVVTAIRAPGGGESIQVFDAGDGDRQQRAVPDAARRGRHTTNCGRS